MCLPVRVWRNAWLEWWVEDPGNTPENWHRNTLYCSSFDWKKNNKRVYHSFNKHSYAQNIFQTKKNRAQIKPDLSQGILYT